MNTPAAKKHFTVEQANQSLPLVRAIVKDIVDLYQDLEERGARLARIRQQSGFSARNEESVYSEELADVESALEKDKQKLYAFVDELNELGIEFKDPVKGLVDFPAMMDGREVLLCWHLGEDDVSHWHELDAGFAGRQSLLEGSFTAGSPQSESPEKDGDD